KRPYRPGEHGTKGRRGRLSEYGIQLHEKQKAKYVYGILERQFHKYYVQASKEQNVGLALLQLLETRLDSVIYKAGFALTQNQARQFVSHGHVTVNGQKVSIPSFQVKPGMKVSIDTPLRKMVEEQRGTSAELPVWVKVDKQGAELLALPTREQIPSLINEQLIVEFYSR
ncbi:30S ribosomal protein S4, partial [Patescibacteria group bacterium]|nr:30S ribosomal protein S4 [Patescibacteria group bacterium]